jgi:hypothetical protein
MSDFECFICGTGKPPPPIEPDVSSVESGKEATKPAVRASVPQIADATIVYVLGKVEDTGRVQVDEYSGINGLHIRTIPGRRWNNPVMVGAGAALLAVVDRFADYDIVRVTDKYAGAGVAGFDSDGFPRNIDWEHLSDVKQAVLPTGTFVTGLKINARGMLIMHVTDKDGNARYITEDATGADYAPFKGDRAVKEPFNTIGTTIGTPAPVTAAVSPTMHQFVGILRGSDYAAVAIIDALTTKVVRLFGLPNSLTGNVIPMGAAYGNNVMTVVYGDGNYITKAIRFIVDTTDKSIMAKGKNTPTPGTYIVNLMPAFKDFKNRDFTQADLPEYLNIANAVNEKDEITRTPIDLSTNLPTFDPAQTSDELNDDLTQETTTVTPEYYSKGGRIPVASIDMPVGLNLKSIESGIATITQLFTRTGSDGLSDRTQPIFRVLHASHYDWISEGGYTYGYADEQGETQGITNGMVGQSIATDKDYELGKLKGLDLKAALIDSYTGLVCFNYPKPLGLRVYGGDYASLDPIVMTQNPLETEILALTDDLTRLHADDAVALFNDEDDTDIIQEIFADSSWKNKLQTRLTTIGLVQDVKRTIGTTNVESQVSDFDGVQRNVVTPWIAPTLTPKRTSGPTSAPVPNFDNTGTADDYWTLFLRKPSIAKQNSVVNLIRRNWSTTYTDPDTGAVSLLPEWVSSNGNPIEVHANYAMLVTGGNLIDFPIQFNYTGQGGFYPIGMPVSKMTNIERYQEEISSVQLLSDAYQATINVENHKSDPDHALITKLQTYIDEDDVRIVQLNGWISTKAEKSYFMFSRPLLTQSFSKLSAGLSQVSPWIPEPVTPDKTCIVEPGPYAWIALTLKFRADSMSGKLISANPEYNRTGLGKLVYTRNFPPPSWVGAYNYYEGGYMVGRFGGDAFAAWDCQIKFIPDKSLLGIDVPDELIVNVSGTSKNPQNFIIPVGYTDIALAAPIEAQDVLLADYGTAIGSSLDEIFTKTLYFMSKIPIKRIEVNFGLTHRAFDVYRWGFVTQVWAGAGGSDDPVCPSTDPGYWAGNTCESMFCGNVLCGSMIYGSNNKLLTNDPLYSRVTKQFMRGSAVFTCQDSPYAALGLAYGTVWKCDVDFNLNNNVVAFAIPLDPAQSDEAVSA